MVPVSIRLRIGDLFLAAALVVFITDEIGLRLPFIQGQEWLFTIGLFVLGQILRWPKTQEEYFDPFRQEGVGMKEAFGNLARVAAWIAALVFAWYVGRTAMDPAVPTTKLVSVYGFAVLAFALGVSVSAAGYSAWRFKKAKESAESTTSDLASSEALKAKVTEGEQLSDMLMAHFLIHGMVRNCATRDTSLHIEYVNPENQKVADFIKYHFEVWGCDAVVRRCKDDDPRRPNERIAIVIESADDESALRVRSILSDLGFPIHWMWPSKRESFGSLQIRILIFSRPGLKDFIEEKKRTTNREVLMVIASEARHRERG